MMEVRTHRNLRNSLFPFPVWSDPACTVRAEGSAHGGYMAPEDAARFLRQHPEDCASHDGWPPLVEFPGGLDAIRALDVVIVTRHAGLVAWLAQQGITGTVISHATTDDVAGRIVYAYNLLPLRLAAAAFEVRIVSVPAPILGIQQGEEDLTPDKMDAAGAMIVAYRVMKVDTVE